MIYLDPPATQQNFVMSFKRQQVAAHQFQPGRALAGKQNPVMPWTKLSVLGSRAGLVVPMPVNPPALLISQRQSL